MTSPSTAFAKLETAEQLTEAQIDDKAKALLNQLSLDEKLGLMDGDTHFWAGQIEMMQPGGYSSRPWVAGAVERLGIPGIRFVDGPRGIIMKGATTFPVSMARGASWDIDLEERVGDAIGRELRALGGNLFGGVCINLLRHPAWGRAQEVYGEDPFHLGEFGSALTRGVQRHVMACVKHYALNSMENARFSVDVTVDDRALHEVYLPHFKRVVDGGVASVMSAYNSVNGEWCGQNKTLLTDILKEMWDFKGFVITDFIFGMRDSKKAVLAGQDIEMPFGMHHAQHLKELVENGEVPEARINDAALRILRQEVRFAQGRDSNHYTSDVIGSEEHRQLAREAAEKSIVLLKNEANLLPLKQVKKLAVIGSLADTANTGDGGSSNTHPDYVITPLEGLQNVLGDTVEIIYSDGINPAEAESIAKQADVALLVVGYTHLDEGEFIDSSTFDTLRELYPSPNEEELPLAQSLEGRTASTEGFSPGGDRASLTLKPEDESLIQAVAAANPRTIVAVMAGSAVIMENWREQVGAILMLWYPGMEGGNALANILTGKMNPSGKLPCIFPASDEHLPYFDRNATEITYDLWHGYRKLDHDGNQAAFPFGFGLSYTSFAYANLSLLQTKLGASDTVEVNCEVSNEGEVAGDEVVQLYVAPQGSHIERAPKELKAFARVSLSPNETKTVQLSFPVKSLAYYDSNNGWTVEKIDYEVIVGCHADDPDALKAKFTVV